LAIGQYFCPFEWDVKMQSRTMSKLMVRLPADVKEWLETQAARNAASQASEIVRAVRERMERCAAVANDQTASKGSREREHVRS
jgi:hypothetical protein